jgi:anhydro-N-acetylmuramic acid kinase
VLAHEHLGFGADLRQELLALNEPGADELHRAALAANAVALHYAEVVGALLAAAGCTADAVRAIGAHGQTVRHRPHEFDGIGYTLQLVNGALLAERSGVDVVCDLRSRDVAAGGQGAPLVPAFHAEIFGGSGESVAVLNLGGIANLTLLPAGGPVTGFDCGPGNALLDLWCQRHRGAAFDDRGAWAASGRVDQDLLARLSADPFFERMPPKSTGRDLFNVRWLEARLGDTAATAPRDVQATLAALTANAVCLHLQRHAAQTSRLLVCGGGVRNDHLMRELTVRLPAVRVSSTQQAAGIAAEQVEALAFAWLARARLVCRAGNLPGVTGASGPRVLGAVYRAA